MAKFKCKMKLKIQMKRRHVWHLTCTLASAEALAQAGQGSAGGVFGFKLSFSF
jgi:hypothetical protein